MLPDIYNGSWENRCCAFHKLKSILLIISIFNICTNFPCIKNISLHEVLTGMTGPSMVQPGALKS